MMYRDVSNNIGRFTISMDMIEHHYDEVLMIMKDILVISAVAQYAEQIIEYKGVSKKYFDPVERGHQIPQYGFVFMKDGDNTVSIKCERIK